MDNAWPPPIADSNFGPLELFVVLLAIALVVLAITWGWSAIDSRLNSRPCPRCGHRVRNGKLVCDECSFDFGATSQP